MLGFMIIAPLAALISSFVFTNIIYGLGQWLSPKVNEVFKYLQVLSSIFVALSHGTNDAQKTMGVVTLGLISVGLLKPINGNFIIPQWVIFACAGTIALGIGIGGRRIAYTLGMKIYRIRPVHGFCAQTVSASIIYAAALFGFVVSTSQMVSSAIAGSGAADKIKHVRWGTYGDILFAWAITMPSAALISAVCCLVFRMTGWLII
jgi:PiT family inorganic phosphate transporter